MNSTVLVALVLLVVVALAAIAFVVARGSQRRDAAREHANELRSDPVAAGAGVHEANLEAQRAQEEAERLRRQAAAAEERATDAQQGVTVEQARQEDQLRQADRLDPDVKTRSDGYQPTAPAAGPIPPPEDQAPATEPLPGQATHQGTHSTHSTHGATHGDHEIDPGSTPPPPSRR